MFQVAVDQQEAVTTTAAKEQLHDVHLRTRPSPEGKKETMLRLH
jgi:hypothetical protein